MPLNRFTRLDAGGLPLNRCPVSISDMISDSIEQFSAQADAQGIRLRGSAGAGVDPVVVDAPKIGRALANLPRLANPFIAADRLTVRLTLFPDAGDGAKAVLNQLAAGQDAGTLIDGFVVVDRSGRQFLVYNGTALPGYSMPSASVLISPPLKGYGWQNITFRSDDGALSAALRT